MDKFGDYLFYLLPGPLKKDRKRNQFRMFFQVIGRQFDEMKDTVFRIREEGNLITASPQMLEVFAQERDMYRYQGEDLDGYRDRLLLKAYIAELSGTERGILLALESIGYTNCSIVPRWKEDPEHWAEVYIDFEMDPDQQDRIDFACVQKEVRKTKQASTLPLYRFLYPIQIETVETVGDCSLINSMTVALYDINYLNGDWSLDGEVLLDAEPNRAQSISCHMLVLMEPQEIFDVHFELRNNLHYLDGAWNLDGGKSLNAYIIREEME